MPEFKFREIPSLADLGFTVACNDIAVSPNGKKMLATGIYKPTIKMFDLRASVMKFERHLVADPLKNFFLDEDGEKFAILRNDKTIEFHIKGGLHEKIRLTSQPQDVAVNKFTPELFIGGNYNEINRFNLEQGRFMKSISGVAGTRMSFSDVHSLLAAISKNKLTFVDTKSRSEIFSREYEEELVTVAQDDTGLKYTVGTESGQLLEYDLRSPKVFRVIELDSFPIKAMYSGKNIATATSRNICLVDDASIVSNFKPGFIINSFCVEGGAIFVGGESTGIKTFVDEEFGRIPEWIFETKS